MVSPQQHSSEKQRQYLSGQDQPIPQRQKSTADPLQSFGEPSYLDFMKSQGHMSQGSPVRPPPSQLEHNSRHEVIVLGETPEEKRLRQAQRPQRRRVLKTSANEQVPQPSLLPYQIPDAHVSRLGRKRKELRISGSDLQLPKAEDAEPKM